MNTLLLFQLQLLQASTNEHKIYIYASLNLNKKLLQKFIVLVHVQTITYIFNEMSYNLILLETLLYHTFIFCCWHIPSL